ncbi:MAG: (4Fe-4S)-binding protein [Gammaproteobacteria bacterium]
MQVRWDQDKCCHAGVCVSSLPDVFKIVDGQFVIDTTQASDEAIQNVVDQCPSGALQIVNE